jgi:phage N-6-adenine-methyltransferase
MSDRWLTPSWIFEPLMAEFNFDLDAAADSETARCQNYLTDALTLEDWPGSRIWLNPPYGQMIAPFVRKAASEAAKDKTVVALIPFRCRAAWWHECVIGKASEVRCIRTRPKFVRPDGSVPKNTGSCDSCIVVWRGTACAECGHSWDDHVNLVGCHAITDKHENGGSFEGATIRCLCQRLPWSMQTRLVAA